MATEKKVFTIAEVQTLRAEKRDEFIQSLKGYTALKKQAENATTKLESSHKENGKFIFSLRCEHIDKLATKAIAASMSFTKYHKAEVGQEPHHKAEACANTIRGFVESKLITEETYDDQTLEAILLASRIFTKADDKTDHPAVLEAAEVLKKPGAVTKYLKAILERFDKQTVGEGLEETEVDVFLTPEEAAEKAKKVSPLDAATICDGLIKANGAGAMLAALLMHAECTTDAGQAELMVSYAVKFRGALLKTEAGKLPRFTPAQVEEWRRKHSPAPVVTDESEKAKYFALIEEAARMEAQYGEEKINQWVDFRAVATR